MDGNTYKFKFNPQGPEYMMPTIYLPTLTNPSTQKFVGAYSVEATVIDMDGERHWIRYSVSIDTSITSQAYPFISYQYLQQFIDPLDIEVWASGEVEGSNSTICIEEYRGYIDVDYYELSGGSWTKVTDTELLNQCLVTYPRYDTSSVTDPSLSAKNLARIPFRTEDALFCCRHSQ